MAGIEFVEVVAAGPRWTKVLASDGNTYTFKGDRNWRNNNPGNIEYGSFARSQGAIGSDGRFAVFPSYGIGAAAQGALQFDSSRYRNLTIKQAIARYAPAFENDSHGYARQVAAAAGVSLNTRMSDLTPAQRQRFLQAQQRVEGFKPGRILGATGKPVPASVAQQFRAIPLPPLGIPNPPIPANLTRSLDVSRTKYAANLQATAPRPVTMSPALAALRAGPAQSLLSDSVAAPFPATMSATLAASRGAPAAPVTRVASLQPQTAYLPSGKPIQVGQLYRVGNDVVRGSVGANGQGVLTKVSAGMADVLFDKGIAGSVARHFAADQVRNGVSQVASAVPGVFSAFPKMASDAASTGGRFLGDLFGGKPTPSVSTPSTPAPTYQPGMLGRGQPAQSLLSSSSNSGPYDPTGRGASFSDLKNFTSPPKTSGIAGTVVLPHNVTPQVPQIAPPQTTTKTVTSTVMVPNPAYIPPKGSVVTPTGGTITQSQMDAIRAVPTNSYMKPITPAPVVPQFIPKQVTKTIQVPLPVAPVPAPVSQKLMARANAMPPPLTLQGMLQNWWAGTPLGSGINAIMGVKPPAQTGGLFGGGGLLGAVSGMLPRQQTAMNIAAQAQRDPLGYAIGQANRASPSPTYDVSGGNNAFNPASIQNSSRWQTGY